MDCDCDSEKLVVGVGQVFLARVLRGRTPHTQRGRAQFRNLFYFYFIFYII
jgi:hypothetical protein